MKQLIQNISSGRAVVTDIPAPAARRGQILVRVMASLISAGTERSIVEFAEKNLIQKALARPDLVRQLVEKSKREGWMTAIETARNRLNSEMALGYSNAGVVVDVGDEVIGFRVGDRVACAGGGYATHSEIVRIPQNLAAPIPAGPGLREVSFEDAACATVASIGLQGIRLAEVQLGEVVAVIGLGLVGQMTAQLARACGCVVVGMDPDPERCKLAARLGGHAIAQNAEEMRVIASRASNGNGVDVVLIAAATESNAPVSLAAEIARDRARVVAVGAVGLSLPRRSYYMKELDFRVSRSYGPGRYDRDYEEKGHDYPIGYVRWTEGRNLTAVLQLMASGQLDFSPLITHRIPIHEAEKGCDLIGGKSAEPFLGVIITYPEQPSLARRIENPSAYIAPAAANASVRAGVIGSGSFAAATLLPAMKAAGGIDFTGICSGGGLSAQSLAARYGFRYSASDDSQLLNDDHVNTIVICTRHSSHASLVTAALKAGKHVFCEKPLALNEEQLASIVTTCNGQNPSRLLTVGYNRRFAPFSKTLRAFVSSAQEPFVMHYRVNAGFIPRDHWTQDREEGGGRILGEVCHFVDFLSFICGQHVVSVSAAITPNAGRYSDDNLSATLRFADGSVGTITYSANGDRAFSKERVEVFVQGRVAVLDDFRELRTVENGRQRVFRSHLRVDKGHRGEWVAFRAALCSGGPPPIALADLVNSSLATIALARAGSSDSAIIVNSDQLMADTFPRDPASSPGEDN